MRLDRTPEDTLSLMGAMHDPISLPFLLASIAVILVPGPDILYVVAKGMAQGRRTAIVAACGFASGLSIHTLLAVLGLSALLMASALAFTVVKLLGAAYLIYLGVKAFRSEGLVSIPPAGTEMTHARIYRQAFVMNVLNPKVSMFFLAFLPQFTHPEHGSIRMQFLLLGVSFALLALSVFSTVGAFSSAVGGVLRSRPGVARALDRVAGGLFVALGVRLATARLH